MTRPANERAPSSQRRSIALGMASVAFVLAIAWTARSYEGRRSLAAADEALERADPSSAIVLARAAAGARCPLCGAPELAFGRLTTIARDAESRGDDATAIAAWRAIRSATLSSAVLDRSPARRRDADAEIARLEQRRAAALVAAGGAGSPAASAENVRLALAEQPVPPFALFLLLAVGGVAFAGGVLSFVRSSSIAAGSLTLALGGGALAIAALLLF